METISSLASSINHTTQYLHSGALIFGLFLLLLLLLFSLLFLKLSQIHGDAKPKLPPTPQRLPLIGNLHQLGSLPHRSFHALSKKYGPVMLLHLGSSKTLVISSGDVAREMIKTHDIVFAGRPKTTAGRIFFYDCKDIGFSPYGEYWRQIRKVSVLELLSLKRVQSFQCVREEEASELVNRICQACLDKSPVNLSKFLLSTSNNIISRCVFGRKWEEEKGTNRFGYLANKLLRQYMEFSFGDFFPLLGWLDVCTGLIRRFKETFREMDAFFDQVIEEHNSLICDGSLSDKYDFVSILLQLQNDNKSDCHLSRDSVKAIVMDMIVGGTDTTFTILDWAFSELVRNPSVMKKSQDEVRRIVGMKTKVDKDDIIQMRYLKCVIKETMRLHPPAPLLLPRETSSRVMLYKYQIPEKTRVFVNAWAIQRDPTVWTMPENFIPERFEDNPLEFRGQDFEFMPFGIGRRVCPGMSFGMASVEYVLANLLYWFDWSLPEGNEKVDMRETFGLTVSRKNPLCLLPAFYPLNPCLNAPSFVRGC